MKKILIFGDSKIHYRYPKFFEGLGFLCDVCFNQTNHLNYDLLVLTGGGDLHPFFYGQKNVSSLDILIDRDIRELDLIDHFVHSKKPIIGICRGLQVVNVYFGGSLHQQIPNPSLHYLNGGDVFHSVQNVSRSIVSSFRPKMIVNSAHRQRIGVLGSGLVVESLSCDGTIEGVRHQSLPIYLMQYHPERLNIGGEIVRFVLDRL